MSESAELVNSEERFRSLFQNNLDLILFQDHEGVIWDVNSSFLTLLNRTKDEVVGRTLSPFLPPELVPVFNEKLQQAFAGTRVQFDVAVQFKGAEPRVLNVSKVPLWVDGNVRGVHMVARDITELTASHQLIEQQARKLNTIFESITDALFLIDWNWCFTYLNHEVERLLHVERANVLGKNIWEVFSEEVNGAFYQQYHHAIATGKAVHFEAYYAKQHLWLEVKAFPSEAGLSVYFSDISRRMEAQASQERLTQDLYRHNQDLQQFTYLVSHNLRAPLTNALGLARLLQEEVAAPSETLAYLEASLEQLDVVFQDMNTILSVRDRQDMTAPESMLLADVLGQVLFSLQEEVQRAGAVIRLELPGDLRVHGNRAYLYSIFYNLLTNSLKYRSSDRPLRISITGTRQPPIGVHLSFEDNGSGFDREKAGTDVFKLYKRFHETTSGRGVGLYLIKTHLESMGGRIEAQSQVGVGTQFTLLIP
ncbi:PAS domain-containing protein [Hymenobacter sp. GOD-10R]|uniref:PAS domain-containing protein n=1 Tax=Hymenobacter sp. GOD-10R TaxID=3093922 RepID=UPI002D78274A|nr:PAS domain-containing protein [Hymenobacter sp. GOD-10R]WRQ29351.1 PAS domain-containing protein [Hymenobacter sp. GOD-10R]